MQGHIATLLNEEDTLDFQKWGWYLVEKRQVRYGLTQFNHFCGGNTAPETPLGSWRARCGESKFASVYFRQGRTRLDYGAMRRSLGPYIEKRICKHTSYPRGSSSQPRRRVAVNPCTLILMRLRHVRHTRALYSAGSPHRRKHKSSTREFTAPTVNTNNLFAISASRLSIFPFCATVSYVASPISFG